MNIALRAFWSNQPMPIQQKIANPDIILNIPFGNVLTLKTGVTSINNKTGNVVLNAIDIGADSVGAARNVYDELSPKVDALIDHKLDKIDYVQHFRGLFSSYSALHSALPTALDGDYAHIDSGSGFDRMCAIWDSDDTKWKIIETNITANTDEIPEGSNNLYFKSERVRQTALTGLSNQNPSDILATDSLITALAKLQAQINLEREKFDWIDIRTLQGINFHAAIDKTQCEVYLAKKNGLVWIRGAFRITTIVNAYTEIFAINNPNYQIASASPLFKGSSIGRLAVHNYVYSTGTLLNADFLINDNPLLIRTSNIGIGSSNRDSTVALNIMPLGVTLI